MTLNQDLMTKILLVLIFVISLISLSLVSTELTKPEKEFKTEIKMMEEICLHDMEINPIAREVIWWKTDDCILVEKGDTNE